MSSPQNSVPLPVSASKRAAWFAAEVLPHDAQLRAYIRGAFPRAKSELDDLVQESYLRVWRARVPRPHAGVRALLFRVARHVTLDFLRRVRRSPVDFVSQPEATAPTDETPTGADLLTRQERIDALIASILSLPPRGREVLLHRKFHGYSQRETAARLGISEKTVDEHLARALRRLGVELARREIEKLGSP